MSLHIISISQIRGEEKFIHLIYLEVSKEQNTNLILYNYQNGWLLVQPALQDNEDNDLFIGTWWKQSFSLGLTRTSTAQMFPDDDNANDDSSATMMMTIC